MLRGPVIGACHMMLEMLKVSISLAALYPIYCLHAIVYHSEWHHVSDDMQQLQMHMMHIGMQTAKQLMLTQHAGVEGHHRYPVCGSTAMWQVLHHAFVTSYMQSTQSGKNAVKHTSISHGLRASSMMMSYPYSSKQCLSLIITFWHACNH